MQSHAQKKQNSTESWNVFFGTFSYSKFFDTDDIYPSWSVDVALAAIGCHVDTMNHK